MVYRCVRVSMSIVYLGQQTSTEGQCGSVVVGSGAKVSQFILVKGGTRPVQVTDFRV